MQENRETRYDPLQSLLTALPERIPVMPVKSTVVFPTGATGLQVSFPPNVEVLGLHPERPLVVALVSTDSEETPIDPASMEKVGVLARVLNRLNLPGGLMQATIQGVLRIHLDNVRFENEYYSAYPRLVEETPAPEEESERLIERILTTLGGIGAKVERLADVPRILRRNIGDPGRFADLVATLAHFDAAQKDEVLQRLDVGDRLRYVLSTLEDEWERVRAPEKPTASEKKPAKRGKRRPGERTTEIRKEIAALQAELGELDPAEREALELLRRVDGSALPRRVASVAQHEAERVRNVAPSSTEATEIRHYVEVLTEIPWERTTEDASIDLQAVRKALDEEHLGLEEVKRHILEFLSVARLRGSVSGPVPCIVGPPGVGKRTLAGAIARGLGRPLARVELGGRGEAQLVGSRRTRSGARPGKLIDAYRDVCVRDPVFLLEEMDQIGLGNVEGDPVEAMEEFLDPANRKEFVDRYVDLPFDLSDTVFIATANDFYRVPRALREFMIEIRIAGYTPEEKVEIAREQMLPRLVCEHGLDPSEVEVDEETLGFLTRGYARDSGLGNLRRSLSALLRFIAHQKALGKGDHWTLTREVITEVLGIPRYAATEAESAPEIGVVTGLAWTASGGELMFIEALKMPGTGRLIITGLIGEVMRESVNAAYSYVRSRADALGIPNAAFGDHDVHVHFPVGATPKDGPSAGAAVTLAIASSLADRPVRHDVAMTGEVTLRGRILEIGGVKEKTLAAYRAGIREMLLPAGNDRDLRDVPDDVREGMTF
ncbi:MAG TPA: S16 family serine protease, partial [Longimicrobiaceae bacterium]|nr:S16 family serine protease [Longimicrobiaceae bacterium]